MVKLQCKDYGFECNFSVEGNDLSKIINDFGTYMYEEYQPNFIIVQAGQPVQAGPVVYTVEHIGEHKGDEDIKPENIFFQIKISAENVGSETTLLSGGQFYLLDES